MSVLDRIVQSIQATFHGSSNWPPAEQKDHWEQVEYFRARYENDAEYLVKNNTLWHDRAGIFTPVPLAREMARLSSALLFSKTPKITLEGYQDELDALVEENALASFLQEWGQYVAAMGRGGLRVIWDAESSDKPIISFLHEDQIIWDERHGKIVRGGVAVIERAYKTSIGNTDVFRLLEEHTTGLVTRELYKGSWDKLGFMVPLDTLVRDDGGLSDARLAEFADLKDSEETGLDTPTLIRWDNVAGGDSDIQALGSMLDRLDEYESLLTDKVRKSIPRIFAHRSLANENGRIDVDDVILVGEQSNILPTPDANRPTGLPIETVQPALQSAEHIAVIQHLIELCIATAGRSLASYGLDDGGAAPSGTALKLRQSRTLLDNSSKAPRAIEAVTQAVAVALAMDLGQSDVRALRPKVELGDGLPSDEAETARTIAALTGAEAISTVEKVRKQHPDWNEFEIEEEVERIENAGQAPDPLRDALNSAFGGGSNLRTPEEPQAELEA